MQGTEKAERVRRLADERDAVAAEVEHIQEQLGNRNRTTPDGRRLSPHQYWTWRQGAAHALRKLTERLRAVKAEMRELAAEPTNGTIRQILHDAADVFRRRIDGAENYGEVDRTVERIIAWDEGREPLEKPTYFRIDSVEFRSAPPA